MVDNSVVLAKARLNRRAGFFDGSFIALPKMASADRTDAQPHVALDVSDVLLSGLICGFKIFGVPYDWGPYVQRIVQFGGLY